MPFAVRKSIIVGLGGTGRDAVLNVKRKLREVYGEVPPTVKFLVFDTTMPTTEVDGERLEGGEFVPILVEDAVGLIKSQPDIRKWFPDRVPQRSAIDGAGQIRGVGRMALFANSKSVLAAIKNTIGKVRDYQVGRANNDKFEVVGRFINVSIVGSLGGGTGSGTFLDIAFLFRNSGLSDNDKIIGYLLLPSIFRWFPFTDNVEPNCYAALKELDYFMNIDMQTTSKKYDFGDEKVSIDKGPFNVTYLIDNINKQGTEYRELDDITEFLGTGLFLSCGALAKNSSDTLDNAMKVTSGLKKVKGKRPSYSSFGISEVVYNGQRLADLISKQMALKMIDIYTGSVALNVSKEVEELIDTTNIREDGDRDDVIDAILPPSKPRQFDTPEPKKGASQRIVENKTTFINRTEEETLVAVNKNYDRVFTEKARIIKDDILRRINSSYGTAHAENFLNILIGRLEAFKSMMNDERSDYELRRKKTQSKYEPLVEEIKKSEAKILGTTKAVQEACLNYARNANNESSEMRERKRRERAADFFANLIAEMKAWQTRLNEIKIHLSRIAQSLSADVQKARGRQRKVRAFVIELDEQLLNKVDIGTVNVTDFINWLKESNKDIANWADLRTDEIENIILNYCRTQKVVKNLLDTNIEKELMKLSEAERSKIIQQLDDMAVPLWQYSVEARNLTQTIYQFGVTDKEETIMRDQALLNKLPGSFDSPSCVATGDPNRIIFFKTEVAVPAYTVNRMGKFREDYLDENAPFNFHIDKNIEEDLPDLFPESDDEHARRYWSIALAPEELGLGFIKKIGVFFYARSESMGSQSDNYFIKLDQGRKESLKIFLSNVELIGEIRDSVEKQASTLGNATMMSNLLKYKAQLMESARSSMKAELKKQIDLELEDIDSYIASLKS